MEAGPSFQRTFTQSKVLGNETSDEMLARVLQEEERWKMEKDKEKEEFCRLQVFTFIFKHMFGYQFAKKEIF